MNKQKIKVKFDKAINKALQYVIDNSPETIAKTIINQFPDTNINDLTNNIKNYKNNDSWLKTTYIEEELLTNLEDLLIDNKLLDDYIPYKDLIITLKKGN